jgi:hypothetical protein
MDMKIGNKLRNIRVLSFLSSQQKGITIYFFCDLCVLSKAGGGYLQIFKRWAEFCGGGNQIRTGE